MRLMTQLAVDLTLEDSSDEESALDWQGRSRGLAKSPSRHSSELAQRRRKSSEVENINAGENNSKRPRLAGSHVPKLEAGAGAIAHRGASAERRPHGRSNYSPTEADDKDDVAFISHQEFRQALNAATAGAAAGSGGGSAAVASVPPAGLSSPAVAGGVAGPAAAAAPATFAADASSDDEDADEVMVTGMVGKVRMEGLGMAVGGRRVRWVCACQVHWQFACRPHITGALLHARTPTRLHACVPTSGRAFISTAFTFHPPMQVATLHMPHPRPDCAGHAFQRTAVGRGAAANAAHCPQVGVNRQGWRRECWCADKPVRGCMQCMDTLRAFATAGHVFHHRIVPAMLPAASRRAVLLLRV